MIVSGSEYAKLRGRSKGWVTGRIEAGMPAEGAGRSGSTVQINTAVATQWEIDAAKEKAESQPGSERDRLAKAQAEKFELENSRRRGELTLVSYVSGLFMEMVADLAGRLDAMAGRLANDIPAIIDAGEARRRVLDEARIVRSGLADYFRKLQESEGIVQDAGDDGVAAAAENAKRVGGRKPRAARRKRRARTVRK